MVGNQAPQSNHKDFTDPFNAGQMVGMLVVITFLETHKGIPIGAIDRLKQVCADNAAIFFEKPAEDVFLIIDNIVKDM